MVASSQKRPSARRRPVLVSVLWLLSTGGCLGQPLFANPWASLWLLLLLGLATLLFRCRHERERRLQAFVSRPLWQVLVQKEPLFRRRLRGLLLGLGLLFLVGALARPQGAFQTTETMTQSLDIILAVDVSDSMLAADVGGDATSRLTRAKRKISDLLPMLAGHRVGLVAFAGDAFLQCPLTHDVRATEVFLDDLDTDLIASKGTDLPRAVERALEALQPGQGASQAIILMTDGENNAEGIADMIARANARQVPIYTVGIGRRQGAPIPMRGGGYIRDRQGEMVLTRLDEKSLQVIAEKTGGAYAHSQTGDVDLMAIWRDGILRKQISQDKKSQQQRRREELFIWPLLLALGCLGCEGLLESRRKFLRDERCDVEGDAK